MLFNSPEFFLFFLVVFSAYLLTRKNLRWQNIVLFVASYFFYGSWNWKMLFLMFGTTALDYFLSRKIVATDKQAAKKWYLRISLVANLSVLGFFKYFNFFIDSFIDFFNVIGFTVEPLALQIILPVGISFYTFHSISYIVDVYRGNIKPADNLMDYALYISFFPQMVAGPIVRATQLLPQMYKKREITADKVNAAFFLIIWGFFKKMVIADNVAVVSNTVFQNYASYEGLDLFLGVLAFTVQIYCDFSGYTDIARGIAKLMGFEIILNFRLPYFAVDPSDFWKRWHISLSSWLRDYLYISLGGNRGGNIGTYRNLFLTMLLGGLWHGAAWNFVIWGAYHGFILILYRQYDDWKARKRQQAPLPLQTQPSGTVHRLFKIGVMFGFTYIGWFFFRADSLSQMLHFVTNAGFSFSAETVGYINTIVMYSLPLVLLQLWQHNTADLMVLTRLRAAPLAIVYALLIIGIFVFGASSQEFIYFQF